MFAQRAQNIASASNYLHTSLLTPDNERLPMDFLQRAVPKRLSSRLWLITLPSALISFERHSDAPKLPIGRARYFGFLLITAGAVLTFREESQDDRTPDKTRLVAASPATVGGLLALTGVALLLRSLLLALYSVGLAVAAGTGRIAVAAPSVGTLLGRDSD